MRCPGTVGGDGATGGQATGSSTRDPAGASAGASAPTSARAAGRAERERWARRGRALTYWAREHPDAIAVVDGTTTRTFAELDARAERLATGLAARGVGPGSAIAVMAPNRVEVVEVWAAALRGGFRMTPVNRSLTAEEALHVVTDCDAAVLVADGNLEAVERLEPALDARTVLLAVGAAPGGFEHYEGALATEPPHPPPADPPGAAGAVGSVMFYTSGTTGRPKGVERPPAPPDLLNTTGVRPGDVHLCTGPLYHAAPYTFALPLCLSFGGTVVLMDRFDPEATLRAIAEHGVTHTHLVPTMFHRLLSLPEEVRGRYDVSSLKLVLHGAAPCPVPVKRAVIEWFGPVVHEYYAATEGAGTAVDAATWSERPGTVGRQVDGHPFVGDEDARPLPSGEVGLVWLRAPAEGRFAYRGDPDKTAAAYRGDAFTLGDLGYLDDDGFLYLTDRSADLIITGGVNVYPAEVDAVLLTHPSVGDAATVGVPDDEWGEQVVAVVEPRAGVRAGADLAEALVAHCRAALASFKCPRRIEFVTQLPRSEAGKVSRHLVREQLRSAGAGAA